MSSELQWRRCSACKQPIGFGAQYWVCSVSTCNRKRTGLVFCTVTCWEVHLPGANHREAWALERDAPASAEKAAEEKERSPRRRTVTPSSGASAGESEKPVLIVASRLKDYVRERSGYNTSDGVLGPLSEIVRKVCDEAIRNAQREGRQTVLDRDVPES